ncbi:hypothetical protein [Reticulibacter mediterranei]|uniref:hypothetical protein n=1 Tax=Reticulibacter mediterranei TaxID=2778369 RepID=UPI001C691BAA|nr:hypothetical protein [Reticulibacter mediterranei]
MTRQQPRRSFFLRRNRWSFVYLACVGTAVKGITRDAIHPKTGKSDCASSNMGIGGEYAAINLLLTSSSWGGHVAGQIWQSTAPGELVRLLVPP